MSGIVFAASSASAVLVDTGSLKSDVSAGKTALNRVGTTCATWSSEGDVFIGRLGGSVDRLDRKGALIGPVFTGSEAIVALAMKDSRSLVVAVSHGVHIVDIADSRTNEAVFTSANPIISIGLSHDKELLSIVTENSISIHNLSTSTLTPLHCRGLTTTLGNTVFHPTRRSSLVSCSGSQLIIFDVNKPAAPLKVITLGSHVVDVTFIPGGKNLLAAALQNGDVCILDLDKDKPITKKLELKQSLSTIAVSADNALLLLGTTNGHILVHDARIVDKAICSIPLGSLEPIIILSSQKRSGPTRAAKAVDSLVTAARAPPLGDNNMQRTVSATRVTRKTSAEAVPLSKDNRVRNKTVVNINTVSPIKPKRPLTRVTPAHSDGDNIAATPTKASLAPRSKIVSPVTTRQAPRRVVSSTTVARVSANNSPALSPASSTRSAIRPRKSDERILALGNKKARRPSPALSKATTKRTPSPDLPGMSEVSIAYQGRRTETPLGVGYAEEADTTVGMAPSVTVDLSTPPKPSHSRLNEFVEPKGFTPVVCDSPGFLTPDGYHGTSTPPRRRKDSSGKPGTMQLSPMRSPAPRLSAPTSAEAQEFLRNVVREAMLEREEEQREELRALHLDMVKMGRAWKNELRTLMQEYMGDFNAIRLDNERLRAENERLRRGY